jgi:hypothetical protein
MQESDLQLAYYLVLVTDVLGQRARLRGLRRLPQSESETQDTIQVLRETAGFLIHLREGFKNYFSSWATSSAEQFPPEVQDFVLRTCSAEITYRCFSDSIIVSVCLFDDGQETHNPFMGVLGALLAASGMHLLSLCIGRPTRGGVVVGVATALPPENDIYGAALERAVQLEAEVAEYPRISVGGELIQYLAEHNQQISTKRVLSPFDMVALHAAEACQRLIFEDLDGAPALDFLGEEVHRHYGHESGLLDVLPKGYEFVKTEQRRWRREQNPKLSARYDRLWGYFVSRARVWGAEIERLAAELDRDDPTL